MIFTSRPLVEPEYEEVKPVEECIWCGRPLYEGDDVWEICGDYICEECINECKKELRVD